MIQWSPKVLTKRLVTTHPNPERLPTAEVTLSVPICQRTGPVVERVEYIVTGTNVALSVDRPGLAAAYHRAEEAARRLADEIRHANPDPIDPPRY